MAKLNYNTVSNILDKLAKSQGIVDSPINSIDELLPLSSGMKLTCWRSRIRKEDKFEDLVDIVAAESECGGILRTTAYKDPFAHLIIDLDPYISLTISANVDVVSGNNMGGEARDFSNNSQE